MSTDECAFEIQLYHWNLLSLWVKAACTHLHVSSCQLFVKILLISWWLSEFSFNFFGLHCCRLESMPCAFIDMTYKLHSTGLESLFFFSHLSFPLLGASIHSFCKDLVQLPSNFQLPYSHFSFHLHDLVTNHGLSSPKQNIESNFLYFAPSIFINLKYLVIPVAAEFSQHNMVRYLSSCDF